MERMQAKTIAELMHIAAYLGIGGATLRANPTAPPNNFSQKPPQL
jgi:hypothetical protein